MANRPLGAFSDRRQYLDQILRTLDRFAVDLHTYLPEPLPPFATPGTNNRVRQNRIALIYRIIQELKSDSVEFGELCGIRGNQEVEVGVFLDRKQYLQQIQRHLDTLASNLQILIPEPIPPFAAPGTNSRAHQNRIAVLYRNIKEIKSDFVNIGELCGLPAQDAGKHKSTRATRRKLRNTRKINRTHI